MVILAISSKDLIDVDITIIYLITTKIKLSTDYVARTEEKMEYDDVDDESLMYIGPSKY
jgi:hypothetical protein